MKDYNFTINLTEEQIQILKELAEELHRGGVVRDIYEQIEPEYLAIKEREKNEAMNEQES